MEKVLIIDDDHSICEQLNSYLTGKGFETATAITGKDGRKKFEVFQPHIVLLDRRLPDVDGLTLLEQMKSVCQKTPIIMMTAFQDMASTIKAMRLGAYDYLSKPINMDEFELTFNKGLNHHSLIMKAEYLLTEVSESYKLESIIGRSKAMQEIYKVIGQIADTKVTVLIQGESGTGKELIAKAIHYNGLSRGKPFISINCSAIVETLLENELFGHEKGSFTGAISQTAGKFEAAQDGVIFLDEISEMSFQLQAKLLRVLQEKEYEKVGGNETIKVNARFIAATNRDLKALVECGKFREDLFYRLKVVTISLPPLRERQEDIPLIVQHFLQKYNQETNKKVLGVSNEAMNLFIRYPWPGNVRELENTIERAVIFCRGESISKDDLPEELVQSKGTVPPVNGVPLTKALEAFEKKYLLESLIEVNGNKSKAAYNLGIHRTTLLSKLKKYQLKSKLLQISFLFLAGFSILSASGV